MDNFTIKAATAVLFMLLCTSCLKEDGLKLPFRSLVPIQLSDGWEISTPESENIDGEGLAEIYRNSHDDDQLWQIRSLVVFRNGKIVAESYMKDPEDRTMPRAMWSCTKQVVGILAGIAVEKGVIRSTDDALGDYLPGYTERYPDKSGITIDDLLTMRSGIAFENDGFGGGSSKLLRQIPENSLDYVFGLGMKSAPATAFNYNDGDPHLISAVIQSSTGMTLRDWAQQVLVSRLGILNWDWITYKDGVTMGGFGILSTPREMAKICQLIINDGMWEDTPVVSPVWIREMTSAKVTSGETGLEKAFGYNWWIDTERGIEFMYGHGGQYFFIDRSQKMIVAITAEPNTQGDFMLSLKDGLDIYDSIRILVR